MRMKKTMLLVSSSPSTSVGLRSYLTHIFGRYIKLEARLADDVTSELMEQFDLVLFASKGAAKSLGDKYDAEDPFSDLHSNIQFYISE